MLLDAIIAMFVSFISSALICPAALPILHRLKFGQQVREDGPKDHLKKSGTPTMGGIVIILSILLGSVFYINKYEDTIPVLLFILAFGIIGFLDDFLKIKRKKSDGLSVKQKLFLQLVATGLFAIYMYINGKGLEFLIPFTGSLSNGLYISLGILFIPAVFFIVLGTDNGVNFTDGLDGLCSSVTAVVALFFGMVAFKENLGLCIISASVFGSLLGFLIYNVFPAKVFMGDTGSLALGGYVSSMAIMLNIPLFIVFVGFIYFIEVLSVIIQVTYFKKTKGKRIFRMAPIHHHFELGGWSETKVVYIFTLVTILLSILAYLGLSI